MVMYIVIYGVIYGCIFICYISGCFSFCRLFFPSPEAEAISKKHVPISCVVSCNVNHLLHAAKRDSALQHQ